MANYEVHIPSAAPGGYNMTLKVSADNWMAALKAGLLKLGEQGASTQNVMVDIQEDNSIHITDATSGRVFRIRELTEEEAASAPKKRPSGVFRDPAAANTLPPSKPPQAAPDIAKTVLMPPPVTPLEPQSYASSPTPTPYRKTRSSIQRSLARMEPDVEELEHPVKPVTGSIGRSKTGASQSVTRQNVEDVLADVFLRINELSTKTNVEEALLFVLDLAMEKVPCEAGSVLRADAGTGDLTFLCARGPKAKDLMQAKIVVPAGSGIAGFCASEGVSVALSDVQRDPRFYAAVGEKVSYETKSLLTSPMMTHGRSFGCMQLLNRKGGPTFAEHEVGVLSYLSHQAALYLNRVV